MLIKVKTTNANITRQIIVGQIPSSINEGTMQHTATSPTIAQDELSHRELYLVPLYFFIIIYCYFANDVTL